MASKAILRIQKISTNTQLRGRADHNFRTGDNHNADLTKTHLNKELIPLMDSDGHDYVKAFNRRMKEERTKIPRKDSVRSFELIMTYGGPNDSISDVDAWEKACVDWAKKEFGDKNVYSAVVHNDEAGNRHIHALVIPISKDGKLNARSFIGGRETLRKLQDSFAEDMEPFGLERGQRYSTAEYQDLAKFHGAISDASVRSLPSPIPGETAVEYKSRADEEFKKREYQHIQEINELKNRFGVAQGFELENEIFRKKLEEREELIRKREKLYEETERELHYQKSKMKQTDALMYGINNGCPKSIEPNVEELKKRIARVANWGMEKMGRDELLNHDSDKEDNHDTNDGGDIFGI